jgi:hypothetical protein
MMIAQARGAVPDAACDINGRELVADNAMNKS